MRHPTLSLRQRLFLLTVVALLPATSIVIYNEVSMRREREAEVHRSALRIGEQASLEVQRIIEGSEGILRATARVPSVRNFETVQCQQFLADVTGQTPHFLSVAAIDSTGESRCRSVTPEEKTDYADRAYFRDVMATGQFVVGTYRISNVEGQPSLPLAVPIRDSQGTVTGVLAAGLNLRWLNNRIEEREFPADDALTLADREGVIIARHPYADRFLGTQIPEPYRSLVTAPAPGTLEVLSQDGTRRILGYVPVDQGAKGVYVSAGVAYDGAMRPVREATERGTIIALVGAAITFLLAALTANELVREPVRRLTETIQAWRKGDMSARTGMSPHSNELAQVGAAIDAYMDELTEGRAARRRAEEHRDILAQELEHRVRNTLAIVQAVATQTFRNSNREALDTFNGRLVAMAGAHQNLVSNQSHSAGLRACIATPLRPFPPQQIDMQGPDLRVTAKAALAFSMAVHELATNAAKYGALSTGAGRISIDWDVAGDTFTWMWGERGGPKVVAPTEFGFGTRMIKRMLEGDLKGNVAITYDEAGVVCRIVAKTSYMLEHRQDRTQESALDGRKAGEKTPFQVSSSA